MYLSITKNFFIVIAATELSNQISIGAVVISTITAVIAFMSNRNANRSAAAAENSAQSGYVAAVAAENSAQASQEANIYAKKQTELLEHDILHTHSPKLIPIASEHEFKGVTLDHDLEGMTVHHTHLNSAEGLLIEITNVSKGNAYMVSSRLEIDLNELFNNYDFKQSPNPYNEVHIHRYQLRVNKPHQTLSAQILEGDEVTRERTTTLPKNYKKTPIVRENESISVSVPKYILQILIDTLYRGINNNDYFKSNEFKSINLIIEYKTGSQMETSKYTIKKYALTISDLHYIEPTHDDYGNIIGNHFTFSLDFDFIEEE